MKCYYTQRTIRRIMIGFGITIAIISIILAIFSRIGALYLLILSGIFFLGNEFGKINKILIDENIIDVKMPVCRGKYTRDQLISIIISGNNLSKSSTELTFLVNGKRKGCQFETDINLLKDIFTNFKGKIGVQTRYKDPIESELIMIGAIKDMFYMSKD